MRNIAGAANHQRIAIGQHAGESHIAAVGFTSQLKRSARRGVIVLWGQRAAAFRFPPQRVITGQPELSSRLIAALFP